MVSFRTATALLAFSVSTSALPSRKRATSNSSVIDLGYAQYQGVVNDTQGLTTWYGLQFAAPPTGSLRWQPPVPIENSTVFQNGSSQMINATYPVTQCVQSYPPWATALNAFGGFSTTIQPLQSEDCLRLDVIVPNNPVSSSLPVVVQIHGGGYTLGNSLVLDGHAITSYSNGSVIWVQTQYRLGFYGFLGSQAVRTNGVANAGLLDQRAALEWVQRNIATFGGDPTKVTIWGGSAGGGSVTAQMQLYGGETNPPFRAAVPEYPWWQPFHDDILLESQYNELLQASNCTDLECLRNLSPSALAAANQQTYFLGYAAGNYGYGDFYAGPSVDGNIIQDLPSVAFSTGRFSKVPVLVDHDEYEGAIFSNFSITSETQVASDLRTLWQTNSTSLFTRLNQLYPESDYGASYFATNPEFFNTLGATVAGTANNSAYWQLQSIFGDFIIACPTYYTASALTDSSQPVYKLVFSAGSEVHSATSPFFLEENSQALNATLAAIMKSYFLGFAVNLDPNSQVGNGTSISRPEFPTYIANGTDGGFNVLWVNTTSLGARPDPDANEKCDFFMGQAYIVRN